MAELTPSAGLGESARIRMVAHMVLLTRVGRRGLINIVLIKLVGICVSACSINIFINILIIWRRGDGTAEVKLGEVCRELGTRQL